VRDQSSAADPPKYKFLWTNRSLLRLGTAFGQLRSASLTATIRIFNRFIKSIEQNARLEENIERSSQASTVVPPSSSRPSSPNHTHTGSRLAVPNWLKALKWIVKKAFSIDRNILITGFVFSTIAVIPAYRALALARWTGRKDYLEYCQNNLVSPDLQIRYTHSDSDVSQDSLGADRISQCQEALAKGLGPPPFVYFDRIRARGRDLYRRNTMPSSPEAMDRAFSPFAEPSSGLDITLMWLFAFLGYTGVVLCVTTLPLWLYRSYCFESAAEIVFGTSAVYSSLNSWSLPLRS
jgi:hypothetical protein